MKVFISAHLPAHEQKNAMFWQKLKCTSQLTATVVTFVNHKNKKILNKTGCQHDSARHLRQKDSPTMRCFEHLCCLPYAVYELLHCKHVCCVSTKKNTKLPNSKFSFNNTLQKLSNYNNSVGDSSHGVNKHNCHKVRGVKWSRIQSM